MSDVQMSDVQLTNLTLLLTIRDSLHGDRAQTCCRFGLDVDQADRLLGIGIHQVMAIVSNVGQVNLFPPRSDLVSLLSLPLPIVRPFAVVQPAQRPRG
jgi:hypothetical protein